MLQVPNIHPMCRQCGACCLFVGFPPFLPGDTEFDELPTELQAEVAAARQRSRHRPCLWLDLETRTCRHYESRPWLCHELEVAGISCSAARSLIGQSAHTGGHDHADAN